MLQLSEHIKLQEIRIENYEVLYELMSKIYPPAYHYFWNDDCSWYLQNQHSRENFTKELTQENQQYYFVLLEEEIIGIIRLLITDEIPKYKKEKSLKLHRLYLGEKAQGKGVGKTLMQFSEQVAKQNHLQTIWLEAMDAKPQAMNFYKKNGYTVVDTNELNFELLKDDYKVIHTMIKSLN